ncbi:MAG: PAS domain-containing protein [Proteobacteria bacterium]|nr:PAS domain-containing protein [Pseudomonadota bacterium]
MPAWSTSCSASPTVNTLPVGEGIRGLCGLDAESARADAVSFLRHIHRDERERFLASSEASAAALSPWHEEFRMLDADGAQRWVEGHALPQRMPDGTVLWHGHIFDITERKATESDLRETKGNLTMALAAARMVTWRWDLDSNAISSPQDLGEFFDLRGRIHHGGHPRQYPPRSTRIDNAIRQAISQPSAETVRLGFACRAREISLLEVRARAEFDADGRLRGFRGVTVDLTDQRLGDQERSALQDQLQQAQKMELLGLMTGGIAHDFNNILASILGYAGLAARDASATLGERQAGYLEQIRVAAERGAELITQMLAFSRGETAARSPQALSALVQLAVKMLRPTFPSSMRSAELDAPCRRSDDRGRDPTNRPQPVHQCARCHAGHRHHRAVTGRAQRLPGAMRLVRRRHRRRFCRADSRRQWRRHPRRRVSSHLRTTVQHQVRRPRRDSGWPWCMASCTAITVTSASRRRPAKAPVLTSTCRRRRRRPKRHRHPMPTRTERRARARRAPRASWWSMTNRRWRVSSANCCAWTATTCTSNTMP